MMHSIMKQIAFKNGYARPIFVRFTELLNFWNGLDQVRRTKLPLFKGFSYRPEIYGMMHNAMKQIAT